MASELPQKTEKCQKTLFASMLLSSWAPLATGIAVLLGRSLTQFADFIRRTMEFVVLFLSWAIFRYLAQQEELTEAMKKRAERIVNLGVAVVLAVSGLVMLFLVLFRLPSLGPGGNVWPGLIIVVPGLGVNLWFWRRYRTLGRIGRNPIIEAQRQLYLAKVVIDLCVFLALSTVAFIPGGALTRVVDTWGSIAVALYLLWSSFRILHGA